MGQHTGRHLLGAALAVGGIGFDAIGYGFESSGGMFGGGSGPMTTDQWLALVPGAAVAATGIYLMATPKETAPRSGHSRSRSGTLSSVTHHNRRARYRGH